MLSIFLVGCGNSSAKKTDQAIPPGISKPPSPVDTMSPITHANGYTLSGTISGLTLNDLTLVDQFTGQITTIKKGSKTFSLNNGKPFLAKEGMYALLLVSPWPMSKNQNACSAVNAAGVAESNITNVQITCITPIATRLAGADETGVELDGHGTAAVFADSNTSVMDLSGNFWVGSSGSLRKVTLGGDVTTPIFIDESLNDIAPTNIKALAVDHLNNLYTSTGLILSPLGKAKSFRSRLPASVEIKGMAFDSLGNLYFSDQVSNVIYKLPPIGNAVVFAGSGKAGLVDGQGKKASFDFSAYDSGFLTVDSRNNLYITESQNDVIRKITTDGEVTTFATMVSGVLEGFGPDNYGISSGAITIDAKDNLYILNTTINSVFKVTPSGQVITLIGSGVLTLADGSYSDYIIRSISVNAAGDLTLMTGSVGKGSGQVLTIKFK